MCFRKPWILLVTASLNILNLLLCPTNKMPDFEEDDPKVYKALNFALSHNITNAYTVLLNKKLTDASMEAFKACLHDLWTEMVDLTSERAQKAIVKYWERIQSNVAPIFATFVIDGPNSDAVDNLRLAFSGRIAHFIRVRLATPIWFPAFEFYMSGMLAASNPAARTVSRLHPGAI